MTSIPARSDDTASAADSAIAALYDAAARQHTCALTPRDTAALASLIHSISHGVRALVALSPAVAHSLPMPSTPLDPLGPATFAAKLSILLAAGQGEPCSLSPLHANAIVTDFRRLADAIATLAPHDPIAAEEDLTPPVRTYGADLTNHLVPIRMFFAQLCGPFSDPAVERAAVAARASIAAISSIAADLANTPTAETHRHNPPSTYPAAPDRTDDRGDVRPPAT